MILQPKELLALETFAKTTLASYNQELKQIMATSKKVTPSPNHSN